jgi:hypothetical protein
MTKPTVTDEIMTQAIHAAIKETGLIDIISNLDVELKAAKEENARLRERVNKLESCIKVIRPGHDTGKFEPLQTAIEFAEQFINKESTNDL